MSATPQAATPEELKQRIEAEIPGATAEVTGDGHHFYATVSAPEFQGLSRIAQHRRVYAVFGPEVGDRIHALSIQITSGGPAPRRLPTNPPPEENPA